MTITPDSILALHVRQNKLRLSDLRRGDDVDAEAQQPRQEDPRNSELMISAVDDSENVFCIFRNLNTDDNIVRNINIKRIKKSENTAHIQNKHFFGMGYPYFISGYDRHVAVTTDYGILLFSVERSVVAAARQQH